jgi:hypothetical protein
MNNYDKLPRPSRRKVAAAVSAFAVAAAIGVPAANAAPTANSNRTAKIERADKIRTIKALHRAEREIEEKIEKGKLVRVDPNITAFWSKPGHRGLNYQYVTEAPVPARVEGKLRHFQADYIGANPDGSPDVEVTAIPTKNLTFAPSEITTAIPILPDSLPSQAHRIIDTKVHVNIDQTAGTLYSQVRADNGTSFTINVGKTEESGKRGAIA